MNVFGFRRLAVSPEAMRTSESSLPIALVGPTAAVADPRSEFWKTGVQGVFLKNHASFLILIRIIYTCKWKCIQMVGFLSALTQFMVLDRKQFTHLSSIKTKTKQISLGCTSCLSSNLCPRLSLACAHTLFA